MFRVSMLSLAVGAVLGSVSPVLAERPVVTAGLVTAGVVSEEIAPINGSINLARTLQAHGGLERWRAMRTFSYTLTDFPLTEQVSKPNQQTIDLQSRAIRVEAEAFTIVHDGQQTFAKPSADFIGLPPRFYAKGSSYFIMMPYVFADDGITAKDAGTQEYNGRTYNLITISYGNGVGDVKDDYHLLTDPQTHRLVLMHHSVNEVNIERVTWTFDEWQSVGGLLVPAKLSFSPGWNPNPTEPGKQARVTNATLSGERPSADTFRQPVASVKAD